jgi:acetyl-CoA carboxylase carboxyltransferase component
MIGTEVERQGIIRHGAKMVTAVSEATVPKVSVVVRKAYGAGLYAMSGPAFEPEATIALPTAKIAVMGPEAAVNAVFANKIAAIDDPAERRGVRGRAATDLRRRRRHTAAGLRTGDRHHRATREPADRDHPPFHPGCWQGPPFLGPPPRRTPGMNSSTKT